MVDRDWIYTIAGSSSFDSRNDTNEVIAVDLNTGTRRVLVDGLYWPKTIATDGKYIYFTSTFEYGTAEYEQRLCKIQRVSKDGGEAELLATVSSSGTELAVTNGWVYTVQKTTLGNDVLIRIPVEGGEVDTSKDQCWGLVGELSANSDGLYFTSGGFKYISSRDDVTHSLNVDLNPYEGGQVLAGKSILTTDYERNLWKLDLE